MRIGLILGDQLTHSLASLRVLDPTCDRILMAEVAAEASYVPHHPQKIALIFSAMRHFAAELRNQGWQVDYHEYDVQSSCSTLLSVVQSYATEFSASAIITTECGEYRLQHAISNAWQQQLGIPVECYIDDRFICSQAEFAQWAQGRKQLRMEYFYRDMRRKTGLLMQGDKPEGGDWNYDADNRKRWNGDPSLPDPITFARDDIDKAVIKLVTEEFSHHPGNIDTFEWATTRQQALEALAHFVRFRLPYFGDYQDAMAKDQHQLFHSLLSPYINCGLLLPLEVCQAALKAYEDNHVPLNAAEGFIRQIIGWREYVRGIYWLNMPQYAHLNKLGNTRDLPRYYWDGDTKMACMSDAFKTTFNHAYAHHIQRLMVTGNFALIAGIKPEDVCDWYLAVYADAYDWVELPNTLGMVMHADGGYLGSKPYAASGNYIHKMSNYCSGCHYSVKTSTEHDSCPFNSLYWHFIQRHKEQFNGNPRMTMIYRSFEKMDSGKQQAILNRAEYLLSHIDEL